MGIPIPSTWQIVMNYLQPWVQQGLQMALPELGKAAVRLYQRYDDWQLSRQHGSREAQEAARARLEAAGQELRAQLVTAQRNRSELERRAAESHMPVGELVGRLRSLPSSPPNTTVECPQCGAPKLHLGNAGLQRCEQCGAEFSVVQCPRCWHWYVPRPRKEEPLLRLLLRPEDPTKAKLDINEEREELKRSNPDHTCEAAERAGEHNVSAGVGVPDEREVRALIARLDSLLIARDEGEYRGG